MPKCRGSKNAASHTSYNASLKSLASNESRTCIILLLTFDSLWLTVKLKAMTCWHSIYTYKIMHMLVRLLLSISFL